MPKPLDDEQKEVLRVIEKLRKMCKDARICINCPFSDYEGYCPLRVPPCEWRLEHAFSQDGRWWLPEKS